MAGFCWLWALAFFCNAINTPFHTGRDEIVRRSGEDNVFGSNQNGYLTFVCILTPLPVLVAMDVATTSTRVDSLMEALNEKAIEVGFKKGVGADVELHTRVDWLETRLKRTNFAQGIGFRVSAATALLPRPRPRPLLANRWETRFWTGARSEASASGWSAWLAPWSRRSSRWTRPPTSAPVPVRSRRRSPPRSGLR